MINKNRGEHTMNDNIYNKAVDQVIEEIHDLIIGHNPGIRTESTGIGWNEFWGYRSFDHGETYYEPEEEEVEFKFDFGFSNRANDHTVKLLNDENFTDHVMVDHEGESFDLWFKIAGCYVENGAVIVNVEFTEVEK